MGSKTFSLQWGRSLQKKYIRIEIHRYPQLNILYIRKKYIWACNKWIDINEYHNQSSILQKLLSEFFRMKLKFSQSNVFIWTFYKSKRRTRIELKWNSFINFQRYLKKKKEKLLLKRSRFYFDRYALLKTAKQKGSLYPSVFCSHVHEQTDLPSPFLFFSFSVLFSWIMDETWDIYIFFHVRAVCSAMTRSGKVRPSTK